MTTKLYFHPASDNARKARMAAALLNVVLKLELVDIFAGDHKKPEYLAINPNGMVPTLDDDGFILWEANAISQYLASKNPNSDAYSANPKVRADIGRWHCWDLAHWTPAVQSLVFERFFKKLVHLGEPDAAAVEKGTKNFHRFAAVLNGHLEGRDYLVGKNVTLADVSIAAGLMYAGPAGIPVEEYKHILRWFGTIEKLDAWKSTAPPPMG
jgi:glutathione S-transferase